MEPHLMSTSPKSRVRTSCATCPARKNSALKDLTDEELSLLDAAKTMQVVRKKQVLFKEGDPVDSIVCLLSGRVKLSKETKLGEEHLIQLAGEGDMLCSHALVGGEHQQTLTARALETTEVCRIEPERFIDLMEKSPNLLRGFLKKLAATVSDKENTIFSLSYGTVRERVARALLALDNRFGVKSEDGSLIDIRLTREEFACLAGTVLESAVRTLSEFKAKGYIATKGRTITVLKRERLERIAAGNES